MQQAALDAALADRGAVEPATVVADADDHLSRLARHLDVHRALGRLAGLAALGRGFDAMRDGIAQHVLERRLDAIEQIAVHFAVRAIDVQLRVLGLLAGGLAQRAAQVRHHGVEWHHARAQQAVLQLGADPRLLDQQGLGLACQFVQRALDGHQVGYRLGQRTRVLLQLRIAVELQRIERGQPGLAVLALEAGDDLRFGLDFQHAQLAAQSGDGLFQFDQVVAVAGHLLFQPRAVDRHFAGMAHQVVQQVGADADLLLRRTRLALFLGQQLGQVVGQHRHRRRRDDWHGRLGLRRHRRCQHGVIGKGGLASERQQLVDHRLRIDRGFTAGDLLHQRVQLVEARLQRADQRTHLRLAADALLQQCLHRVGEIAHRHQAGNPRATLERVQVAAQFGDVAGFLRLRMPQGKHVVGMIEKLARLVDEHFQQVGVNRPGLRSCRLALRRLGRLRLRLVGGAFLFGFSLLAFGLGLGGGSLLFDALRFGTFGFDAFRVETFGLGQFRRNAFRFDARRLGALGFGALVFHPLCFDPFGFDALGFDPFGFETFVFDACRFRAFVFDACCFRAFGFGPFCFGPFCLGTLGLDAIGFRVRGGRFKGGERRNQPVGERGVLRVIRDGVADHVDARRQGFIVIGGLAVEIGGDSGVDLAMGVVSGIDRRRVVFGIHGSGFGRGRIGIGIFRRVRGGCRGVVRARLEHDVRDLRLWIAVAQFNQGGSKLVDGRQLRLGRIELPHDVVDDIDGASQHLHAIGRQRYAGGAQALEQHLQRREQLRQQRNVHHGDGAVQRMHGAQQFLADGELGIAVIDRRADELHVLRHFAAQDFEQHRVHCRHYRQLQARLECLFAARGQRIGIGQARLRHGPRVDARHAATHNAAHHLRTGRQVILHLRRLTGGKLLGRAHDRAERRVGRAVALERAEQTRQRGNGVMHQRLHLGVGCDGGVEHAVEHVLHLPRKLAQHAGADQAAGTLERVERAADAGQAGELGRIGQPHAFGGVQAVDFFLHFLQEDLTDVVVNAFGIGVETGVRGQRVARGHLLEHLFLNFLPVRVTAIGVHRRRWRGGFGQRQMQAIDVRTCAGCGIRGADEQSGEIVTLRQADGFGQLHRRLDRLLVVRARHGCFHVRQRFALRRQRPVAKLAQAVFGHVQDVVQTTAMVACSLQVIFQRRQRVGQVIHLRAARHALFAQQFVIDEAAHALCQFGRARRRQHVHGTGHFGHQRRHAHEPVVLPARLDKGDDGFLHLVGVADCFPHQRGDHAQRLGARQVGNGGQFLAGLGRAQAFDVVVQRSLDVQQGAGDIQQGFLVGWTQAVGQVVQYAALFADHPTRHGQRQHTQGVADPAQHVALFRQLRGVGVGLAQEQVQRLLDAQQVVLERARHGVEQRPVVPGHRALRMRQLAGLRHQVGQRISLPQQLHLRAALTRVGDDVQQLA